MKKISFLVFSLTLGGLMFSMGGCQPLGAPYAPEESDWYAR